jgi:hypothetical protein
LSGAALGEADKEFHDALKPFASQLSAKTHPNAFAHFFFLFKFSDAVRAKWTATKKSAKKDDDELDLFGDDDEGDAEAAKQAAAAAKEGAKKKKKEVVAMSIVMLDVKPVDDEVSLDDLA